MELLTNNRCTVEEYLDYSNTNRPFNHRVKEFVLSFSESILSNKSLRQYPDIIALAFWMRRKNIEQLEEAFNRKHSNRVACGTVLHFAPSNVDTIFIYSLFISLILGNKNVVRISSKDSNEKNIILNELNNVIASGFSDILDSVMIVTYDHDDEITGFLSEKSNLRVIWGGDDAVRKISSFPLPSTSNEIKFANKYSLSIFKASKLAETSKDEMDKLAINFANDIYWFGQQGCSSPKTIIWIEDIPNNDFLSLKEKFYGKIRKIAEEKFSREINESDYINKIVACDLMAASFEDGKIVDHHGSLTRFLLKDPGSHHLLKEYNCGSGLLIEINISKLDSIIPLIDRTTQTLTYFGFTLDELKLCFEKAQTYPDRVVPVGRALEFSTTWDGYDLLVSMTRGVYYE